MTEAFVGVDVGTGSARAGVFTRGGEALGQHVVPIRMNRPHPNHVEQSSGDIWRAVVEAVRAAVATSGDVTVKGIGFDATCSLVVVDAEGAPVAVGAEGQDEWNVIVWMDHRAVAEAERINAGGHNVLRYVGGRVSLEMETPKLVWLKTHRPDSWRRARHFFDLPDYLTWRATGSESRSLCSLVCKWTYLGHENRWDDGYLRAVGLGDLVDEGFARIGREVLPLGTSVGAGLDARAAAELGLPLGTPVGTSAIDAHAGGIGTIGVALYGADGPDDATLRRRVALVGGTSSCHMAVSVDPVFVPGVWGPYFAAMVPGLWLNEGGQSATGSLIDHIIRTHAAYAELASAEGSIYVMLNERLARLAESESFPAAVTRALHVDPDFLGNRSPHADSTLRGTISGLDLGAGPDDLARLYLATIQAVAYGTRQIIETMNASGYTIDTILASGGGTKNPIFLREHADATGCRIVLAREGDAVLLGAAILGAVASGAYASVRDGMSAMTKAGRIIEPNVAVRGYHDAKYRVFQRLHEDQVAYREAMAGAG
jgi:FGGY-family pentulose kinase